MEDFLLFIVGIFIILIVLTTVFGKGIAYSIFGILADIEPTYLQEDLRTFLTVASYSPGDFEARIKINVKHAISITDEPYPTVWIDAKSPFNFSKPAPQYFLSECSFVKTCEKNCSIIGDVCSSQNDCCGDLSCDPTSHCESTNGMCGNGVLEAGEECDPGNDNAQPADLDCPGNCTQSCTCPNNQHLIQGISCTHDSDCYRLLKCMSGVRFDKVGGTLIIKKYYEDGNCKIKIEKEGK